MDNVKNDAYYIGKVFDDLAFIIRHMKDVDSEAFEANDMDTAMRYGRDIDFLKKNNAELK